MGAPWSREPLLSECLCECLSWIVRIKNRQYVLGFPGGSYSKESTCRRDPGLISGLGRSPEERNGNPFQYSCLENPMDRGVWRSTVHGITESDTIEPLTFSFILHVLIQSVYPASESVLSTSHTYLILRRILRSKNSYIQPPQTEIPKHKEVEWLAQCHTNNTLMRSGLKPRQSETRGRALNHQSKLHWSPWKHLAVGPPSIPLRPQSSFQVTCRGF